MTALQSQIEAIFHADHIRKTEVLGDIGYWEDRVRFIANHAAPVIRTLLAEKEPLDAENAHLREDVRALREALGNLLALVAYANIHAPSDMVRAMEVMIGTAPDGLFSVTDNHSDRELER